MSGTHDMAPAGHDTHLYDPDVQDNQIVALYNTDAEAQAARDKLVASGVDSGAVQVMARDADRMAGGVDYDKGDQGLWGSIKSLFMPDDEAHAYNHAVDKGHAMVVVTPARTANRHQIIDVLESTDPIDFDAKLEEWRQAGYDYGNENKSLRTETATGLATGTGTAMGAVTEAASTAGRSGSEASTINTGMNTAVAASDSTLPTTGTTGAIAGGAMAMGALPADAETVKVMEERLRVGKREVAQGGVRVRSYVVERPIEEQVRLHEERIEVERRPVDRVATAADAAFTDRTLEASATSEEAVINKEARVVEEIELHKDVVERTETEKDTVRKTEVEVEDTPGTKTTGTTHSGPMTTGADATGSGATSSTAGATTSGMNAPRKP